MKTQTPVAVIVSDTRKLNCTYTHNVPPHRGSGMRQQPGSGKTLMGGCHGSSRTNQKSLDIGMRDLMTIVTYF